MTGAGRRSRSDRSAPRPVRANPFPAGSRREGRAAPRGLGGDQVEGRRAVAELLAARRRSVKDVWLSDAADEGAALLEICALAEEAGVPVRRVSRQRLDSEARTEAPQGVLAHASALEEADLAGLCEVGRDGVAPFLFVLDGVTDPQNLGALLRTADGAGVTGLVLPRHRSAHVTPTVAKAAAGAIEHVPIAVVAGIPSALSTLVDHGVWTVGLDSGATTTVWDLTVATEAVALVLGAEGSGLSRLVRSRCDVLVAVPQHGHLASLNVAAAGAVAAFEIARRRADGT